MSEAPTTTHLLSDQSQHYHHQHHRISRSDFSLIDDDNIDADGCSPKNEGQHMFLQVVEFLRLEKEVWFGFGFCYL